MLGTPGETVAAVLVVEVGTDIRVDGFGLTGRDTTEFGSHIFGRIGRGTSEFGSHTTAGGKDDRGVTHEITGPVTVTAKVISLHQLYSTDMVTDTITTQFRNEPKTNSPTTLVLLRSSKCM